MPANTIVFGLVTFLHDLFTAIWIGGVIVIGATTLPAARQVLGKSPQTKQLMAAIQRRQSVLVYVSIVGLLVTGLLLARRAPAFGGLFSTDNTYSLVLTLKHIAVLLMIAIALVRSLLLGRTGARTSAANERWSVALLMANTVLGVAVLLFSGILAAVAAQTPLA